MTNEYQDPQEPTHDQPPPKEHDQDRSGPRQPRGASQKPSTLSERVESGEGMDEDRLADDDKRPDRPAQTGSGSKSDDTSRARDAERSKTGGPSGSANKSDGSFGSDSVGRRGTSPSSQKRDDDE
jgi:hypothetical protein